jgi:hypothetical protein
LGRKGGSYKFETRQKELKKQKKRREKLERRQKIDDDLEPTPSDTEGIFGETSESDQPQTESDQPQ